MPCSRCQSPAIPIGGRLACPRCEGIELVPAADAARTLKALARRARRTLVASMGRYGRREVLRAVFKKREMVARALPFDLRPMDVRTILGCTAALKMLGSEEIGPGGRSADPALLLGLAQGLGSMLLRLEKIPDLEAGTYNLLRREKYSLSDFMSDDSGAFPLYPNERHVSAFGARSDLGMITQSQAAWWAPPPPPPGGGIRAALGTKKLLTVEETVGAYYHLAYMLADVFFGTPVRRKYGAPPGWDRLTIKPLELKKFVSSFGYDKGSITVRDAGRFEALARSAFGDKHPDFERHFVMSGGCPGAFPLFMRIGGRVHVSQFFGELYSCALLTVMHRAEFDRETQRRSRKYESEVVPAYFRSRGYAYHADQGVKNTLQIDGIAVSPRDAYVVEAKYWNPRKFLGGVGRYGAHDDTVRGSIEGSRYDRDTKTWKKRGVALADKAEWVEKNRGRYGICPGTPVKQALVTNTHPVAREYKGCEIIHVQDPDAPGAQDNVGWPAGGGVGIAPVAPPHGGRSP